MTKYTKKYPRQWCSTSLVWGGCGVVWRSGKVGARMSFEPRPTSERYFTFSLFLPLSFVLFPFLPWTSSSRTAATTLAAMTWMVTRNLPWTTSTTCRSSMPSLVRVASLESLSRPSLASLAISHPWHALHSSWTGYPCLNMGKWIISINRSVVFSLTLTDTPFTNTISLLFVFYLNNSTYWGDHPAL